MKTVIISMLFICLISVIFYCNDGIYGNCTSLADEYCSGVEDCTSPDGDKYIKVGSERYNCFESLQLENTYDCSAALAEAEKYCENLDSGSDGDSVEQCYRTDSAGKKICYGDLMTEDQCNACGWSYSAVDCDEYSSSLVYSPPNCY